MKKAKSENAREVRRRLMHRLETRSAELAIIALEEVVADSTAPAPARATAGTTLLRAATYFEKRERGSSEKQPHEMTAEEIAEAIAILEASGSSEDDEENVFS